MAAKRQNPYIIKRAMDRHKRMARTLGCLVASMTLGAILLEFTQPDRPSRTPLAGNLLQSVRPEVSADGADRSVEWEAISVVPQTRLTDDPSITPHIVISPEGDYLDRSNWDRQARLHPADTVLVGLLDAAGGEDVPHRQWEAAWRLVQALQAECSIPDSRITIDDRLRPPTGNPITKFIRP